MEDAPRQKINPADPGEVEAQMAAELVPESAQDGRIVNVEFFADEVQDADGTPQIEFNAILHFDPMDDLPGMTQAACLVALAGSVQERIWATTQNYDLPLGTVLGMLGSAMGMPAGLIPGSSYEGDEGDRIAQ